MIYLMKQYSYHILTREDMIASYKISRGRCVVENAFDSLGPSPDFFFLSLVKWILRLVYHVCYNSTVIPSKYTCCCHR
jgi:hypothetical protein